MKTFGKFALVAGVIAGLTVDSHRRSKPVPAQEAGV